MVIKILMLVALIGHIICGICDLLLIYAPGGKFQFGILGDNEKMAAVFQGMPLKKPLASMLFGVLAMTMSLGGYLALCEWMRAFSDLCAAIMVISAVAGFMPGVAHHVFCGVVEWFYLRLNRTEEARSAVVDFFKQTSVTMYVCYLGQAVFALTFLIAVVTGMTSLPQWGCIFNVIPLYVILLLLKTPGAGNVAGAIMFLGLFLLIG